MASFGSALLGLLVLRHRGLELVVEEEQIAEVHVRAGVVAAQLDGAAVVHAAPGRRAFER